ncbi:MAG: DUF1700 domain-containing protein [Oscillospiraceae bacterium]|jgi:uncharacterized membrane protein|nr:DUF1700 domain-containing protein [Oscillospiraceae bacterium]
MSKNEFLEILRKNLRGVPDADEIVSEYENHFSAKCADGFTEDEVSQKLGDPENIARQFLPEKGAERAAASSGVGRAVAAVGLGGADTLMAMLAAPVGGGIAALGAAALAFIVSAFVLVFSPRASWLSVPYIPHAALRLSFAVSLLALGVTTAVGTWHLARAFSQFLRAYGRWHSNTWAAASGRPVYPPRAFFPQTPPHLRRRIRAVMLLSAVIFAAAALISYVTAAAAAGALEFWHVWSWFV